MEKQRSKKILVNVVKPLITGINKNVEAACLLRDAYLDRVFLHEAEQLEKEMPAANSEDAKVELKRHLRMLDTKPVNFSFSEETVGAINDACEKMNVPRDCFINRVLLFISLNSKPQFFDRLLGFPLSEYWPDHVLHSLLFEYPDFLAGSLNVIQEVISSDPFGPVRACIDAARKDAEPEDHVQALHEAQVPRTIFKEEVFKSSLGFNCYLPDSKVEGHPAQKVEQEMWESMLASLDDADESQDEEKGGKS